MLKFIRKLFGRETLQDIAESFPKRRPLTEFPCTHHLELRSVPSVAFDTIQLPGSTEANPLECKGRPRFTDVILYDPRQEITEGIEYREILVGGYSFQGCFSLNRSEGNLVTLILSFYRKL